MNQNGGVAETELTPAFLIVFCGGGNYSRINDARVGVFHFRIHCSHNIKGFMHISGIFILTHVAVKHGGNRGESAMQEVA